METTTNTTAGKSKGRRTCRKRDVETGARKIRMRSMNKSEIAYMRRKRVFDLVWPFFRFFYPVPAFALSFSIR